MEKPIKLGISSCLLGERVRYDGTHKLDRFITQTLARYVEFVPVCPEMECGFGVPRASFRLVGDPDSPRLVTTRTRQDYTEQMVKWACKKAKELEGEDLCGFIFKSKSPSSGMERINVYNDQGIPVKKGRGIFARIFMEHFPLIPVEDEGRLHDPKLRENFIERLFTMKRWRGLLARGRSAGNLVAFHTQHKLLILSHSEKHHRMMGKLVASGKGVSIREQYTRYQTLLMTALTRKTTPSKNINVLQHMTGYFKKQLSADEKQELLEIIQQYRKGFIPLIVPITLMNHYVRKYAQPYLNEQIYLKPHPVELQLENFLFELNP